MKEKEKSSAANTAAAFSSHGRSSGGGKENLQSAFVLSRLDLKERGERKRDWLGQPSRDDEPDQ